MKKTEFKRINLWVPKSLYDQINKQSDKAYLRVGTYVRQLIQIALIDSSIRDK